MLFLSIIIILAIVVEVTHQGQQKHFSFDQVKYNGDVIHLCRGCHAAVSNCWTEKRSGMVEWTILKKSLKTGSTGIPNSTV